MRRYGLAFESWSPALWAEIKALAEAHFEEVDGGVEPRRKFKLDQAAMQGMSDSGYLKVCAVRADSDLIGYFTWSVMLDVESAGLPIAQQGAWFIAEGHPGAAVASFDFCVEQLRLMGVKCVFPHHRMQGRGKSIGRFFERRGAKEIQRTYCLWIGEGA